MDKAILSDYIDACELIKETEQDIKRLQKKQKTIAQENVSGSNPEFPYNPTHFKIQGTTLTYDDDVKLRMEERILEERKKSAEKLKMDVEAWLNTIPKRMQRIIRYKVFDGLTWEQTAVKIGRNATGEGIRMEYQRFMEKK